MINYGDMKNNLHVLKFQYIVPPTNRVAVIVSGDSNGQWYASMEELKNNKWVRITGSNILRGYPTRREAEKVAEAMWNAAVSKDAA